MSPTSPAEVMDWAYLPKWFTPAEVLDNHVLPLFPK
ncbi:MAG: hypothetical protein JWQ81_6504 [Amycolatopsis sp.]|nr:hypothetical protein [Amycolatopsis sp.]